MRGTIRIGFVATVLISSSLTGCYVYRDRDRAIVPGIDIDETLKVAEVALKENKFSTVLTIWAIRDQELTGAQASRVAALYFEHIDRIDSESQKAREFSVWHLTWAISNMYRHGDDGVKIALKAAYDDAAIRVDALDSRVATNHFYDEELTMGDIHFGGRSYAKSHLVAPGNDKYLQSFEEFEREREEN
jgi:hypothetical protein